jgi:hypothetical protein
MILVLSNINKIEEIVDATRRFSIIPGKMAHACAMDAELLIHAVEETLLLQSVGH